MSVKDFYLRQGEASRTPNDVCLLSLASGSGLAGIAEYFNLSRSLVETVRSQE